MLNGRILSIVGLFDKLRVYIDIEKIKELPIT